MPTDGEFAESLTRRRLEVVRVLAMGVTNAKLADHRGVSAGTAIGASPTSSRRGNDQDAGRVRPRASGSRGSWVSIVAPCCTFVADAVLAVTSRGRAQSPSDWQAEI
jgi:hypothetical protein